MIQTLITDQAIEQNLAINICFHFNVHTTSPLRKIIKLGENVLMKT